MPRGEEQKPVTKAYRSNWEVIFGKSEDVNYLDNGTRLMPDGWDSKKAQTARSEPCGECGGDGKCHCPSCNEDPDNRSKCVPCLGLGLTEAKET